MHSTKLDIFSLKHRHLSTLFKVYFKILRDQLYVIKKKLECCSYWLIIIVKH